ncbi:MAG: glycosyltransferase family 4 protein [bacterium]
MIQKIKIASLAGELGIGGTARQIVTIDKYLNKDFFDHYIILLKSGDNERIKFLESKNIIWVSDVKEIPDELAKNQIDVLYIHRHGRNQPEHDSLAEKLPQNLAVLELNTFSAFDPGFFNQRCDKHIFVSRTNVLKYLVQNNLKFDFDKYKVVHALIDSENFLSHLPGEEELSLFKKKYDLNGFFVVGRIARPVMGKWDEKTITFWKKICQSRSDIKFLIYGVPEERKQDLINAGRKENLIILEPTYNDKELALFYSSLDVLLQLSPIGECSCGTIAEAMLFKKPIIASSTPFPRFALGKTHTRDNGQIEQIENGINGYVIKNAEATAKAVLNLSSNQALAQKMGAKNNSEVLEKYDVKVGIKTLEKIFIESVVEKNIGISEEIVRYYDSLSFYPSEADVKFWFKEYYLRLKKIFCPECRDSMQDKISYYRNVLKRKLRTLLSKFI